MTNPKIPNGHAPRLPWRTDPESPHQILDADGVPVAWGSSTTSVKGRHKDERGITQVEYRTTPTVSAIRAQIIVDAVNFLHAQSEQKKGAGHG